MRNTLPLLALLALVQLDPSVASAQQQQSRAPATQYWMDVATHSTAGMPPGMGGIPMPGMGGGRQGNSFGATRGAGAGKYMDLSLFVRGKPGGVSGTHAIPPGVALGASLSLLPDTASAAPQGESRPPQQPRGRLLIYWGCGESVRGGQPRVIDVARMAAGDYSNAFTGRYTAERGARSGPGYSIWPNRQDSRAVPQQAALTGQHKVSGDGVPANLAFNIGSQHDFMPAVELSARGATSASIPLEWRPVANATGYFANAMGTKGDDTVFWSSSEVADAGVGLFDFLPPATVERWTRERVVLPTGTTRCAIPAGIFGDGGMARLAAYGPELNVQHPPGSRTPDWTVRVRVMSTGMTLLGSDGRGGGRPGAGGGPGGSPLESIIRGIFR
jgi:hypothetical protein